MSCRSMMYRKYIILLIVSLVAHWVASAQQLIPYPEHITIEKGFFKFDKQTAVIADLQQLSDTDIRIFNNVVSRIWGVKIEEQGKYTAAKTIELKCTGKKEEAKRAYSEVALQAYRIEITPRRINIEAPAPVGLFYALQTLTQLSHQGKIRCGIIQDKPKLPYRGLMIDCARHFWSKEFILKQIDALAYFKINTLHLHLTDAEGWRLYINRYPELTQKTAFRMHSSWQEWRGQGNKKYCNEGTEGAYGGYYTQEDMREIVRYAAEKYITVIPEIEMPGHSEEVLYAYPHLSCTGKPYVHSDFCAGNEEVYHFLENVLTEVMDIFPSEYIHIGGDEAKRKAWEKCPKCQQLMNTNQLKNTADLQAYFIHRIEKFLNKNGRKLLGWDEIMDGTLAPNATVMSWRGEQGGIAAAKAGHDVIMTPGKYCYIDKYQDAPPSQPKAQGGYVTLQKVFSYDPIPDVLRQKEEAKHIKGVQVNLWTEYVETPQHVEYMIYPRLLALAEVGWSRTKTSYDSFQNRVRFATRALEKQGYHTFNISDAVGDRKESLRPVTHEALHKKVTYYSDYPTSYTAQGDLTLTNGIRANWDFADGNWQGFIKKQGVDVMIDLEKETKLRDISIDFLHSEAVQIYAPVEISIMTSTDGVVKKPVDRLLLPSNGQGEYQIYPYRWKGKAQGRYIYIKALPRKEAGWLFTDEIIINKKK